MVKVYNFSAFQKKLIFQMKEEQKTKPYRVVHCMFPNEDGYTVMERFERYEDAYQFQIDQFYYYPDTDIEQCIRGVWQKIDGYKEKRLSILSGIRWSDDPI